MNQIDEWIEAFNQKLKTKTFEHFSILLFDNNKSSIQQKELLHKILFEDHKSIVYWSKYIDFAIQTFPDRKLQLQRLINKSLELINVRIEAISDRELHKKILSQLSDLKSSEIRILPSTNANLENENRIATTLDNKPNFIDSDIKLLDNIVENIEKKPTNLSKYIDATLLNFNPKALRKTSNINNNKPLKSNLIQPTDIKLLKSNPTQLIEIDNSLNIKPSKSIVIPPMTNNMNNNSKESEAHESSAAKIIPKKTEHIAAEYNVDNLVNKTPGRKQLFSIDDVSPSLKVNCSSSQKPNQIPSSSTKLLATTNNSTIQKQSIPHSVRKEALESTIVASIVSEPFIAKEEKRDKLHSIIPTPLLSLSAQDSVKDNHELYLKQNMNKKVSFQPAISSIDSIVPLSSSTTSSSSTRNSHSSEQFLPKVPIAVSMKEKENISKEITSNQSTTATIRKDCNTTNSSNSGNSDRINSEQLLLSSNNKVALNHQQDDGLTHTNILDEPSRRIVLNGKSYTRLNVLGKGGSSCVYRIIGNEDGQIYAYKRVEVREAEDMNTVFDTYANEIALLKKLRTSISENDSNEDSSALSSSENNHPGNNNDGRSRIIELVDYEVCKSQRYVAMLLEPGDIDLAKVLMQKSVSGVSQNNNIISSSSNNNRKMTSSSGSISSVAVNGMKNHEILLSTGGALAASDTTFQQYLDPFFARMVWKEMLEAVDHIHKHRIVHGDLKPANFVFVKGHLKLIDFGIAKSFSSDTTNIYRESQIGTINYMAPEAIAPMSIEECEIIHNQTDNDRLKMKLGRASDIWSLGCILYQMIYGRPPFAALNTIQKLTTIPNPKHIIKYNDCGDQDAIDSIKSCLIHDPRSRCPISGINGLLSKPYLQINKSTNNQHHHMMNVEIDKVNHDTKVEIGCQSDDAHAIETVPVSLNIDENKLQSIVGAVLDSLNNIAEQSLTKLKSASTRTGVSTRRSGSNTNNPNQIMERVTKDVIKWLDEVNQTEVECEVMDIIQQSDWWKKSEEEEKMNQFNILRNNKQQIIENNNTNLNEFIQTSSPSEQLQSLSKRKLELLHNNNILSNKKPFISNNINNSSNHLLRADGQENIHPNNNTNIDTITASNINNSKCHNNNYYNSSNNNHINYNDNTEGKEHSLLASTSNNSNHKSRTPFKSIPLNLKDQIQNNHIKVLSNTTNSQIDRASKWMKPINVLDIEKQDMRSILEKRIGDMRKFLDVDQDNITVTDTVDITGFTDFF